MLGWCPRPPLQHRNPGRSCVTPSHEIVHFSPFDDEKPQLQPPHQIVIGFDLSGDSNKGLACESPRSVLEPHHVHRPQSGSPRSPLSALGSLLADRACIGSSITADVCTPDVHTFHPVLKSEHVACVSEKVQASHKASDSVTFSKPGIVRISKNQSRDCQFPSRSGCSNGLSSTIFCWDDEDGLDEDDDVDMAKSIFSAASPISKYSTCGILPVDFLSKCFRCRRRLAQGKDIYMYRGDQAFCSQECRYKQIVADERKDKSLAGAPRFFRQAGDRKSVAGASRAALA